MDSHFEHLINVREKLFSREIVAYCEGCGKELPQGTLFCTTCGETTEDLKAKGIDLYWGRKAPVIGSSIVVKQLIFAMGIGMLFVFGIIAIVNFSAALAAAPILFAIFLFMVAMSLIIAAAMQFFTKGGPYMEYAVTRKGIGYKAGDETKTINTLTLIGSALGGSLSGTGGSLINMAREMDFMEWKEIRSATGYRRDHSILFYRKALVNPFAFYCTPETFEKVLALVRERAPQASVKIRYL